MFNKIAQDAICIITNKANPVPGLDQAASRRSSAAAFAAGAVCPARPRPARSTSSCGRRHRAPRTRSRRSSWAHEDLLGRQPEGVQRLVSSRSSSDPSGIGYVSLFFTKGVHVGPLQGRPLQPAERQVRPVRRRAQLLHGDPRRPDRRRREVDRLDQAQQGGQQDHRHPVGPAELDAGSHALARREADGPRDQRAELRSARWRPRSCC